MAVLSPNSESSFKKGDVGSIQCLSKASLIFVVAVAILFAAVSNWEKLVTPRSATLDTKIHTQDPEMEEENLRETKHTGPVFCCSSHICKICNTFVRLFLAF